MDTIESILLSIKIVIISIIVFSSSCTKLVEISPPANTITTSEVFADSADANSAVLGIYSNFINPSYGSVGFASGALTFYCGLSSDELLNFLSGYAVYNQFYLDQLTSTNSQVYANFWQQPYPYIYQANAIINGLASSTTISANAKNRLMGEALFLRAFIYFYLVNLFGEVPYVTSTSYAQTDTASRTPKELVYRNIINDLLTAVNDLPADFSAGNGQRVRANRFAAEALLARTYLYTQNWDSAVLAATSVIGNPSVFSLDTLNGVFLANSSETILQLMPNTSVGIYNATPEGNFLIPLDSTYNPTFYLSSQLLNSFEPGDQRKISWTDSVDYSSQTFYIPYKYKVGPAQELPNSVATEYYTILRLGEQYLIRAEAEAYSSGGTSAAISDLNKIRQRANLPVYAGSTDQNSVLGAIYHERQVELFAEWGHRWLDLKRTNTANSVLSSIKQNWTPNSVLYPIPYTELVNDPHLTQNPGY